MGASCWAFIYLSNNGIIFNCYNTCLNNSQKSCLLLYSSWYLFTYWCSIYSIWMNSEYQYDTSTRVFLWGIVRDCQKVFQHNDKNQFKAAIAARCSRWCISHAQVTTHVDRIWSIQMREENLWDLDDMPRSPRNNTIIQDRCILNTRLVKWGQ